MRPFTNIYHRGKLLIFSAFVLAFSLSVNSPYAHAVEITLEQGIEKALQNNKKLAAEKKGVEVADNERKSIRGRFLPVLRAEVNAFWWNDDNYYNMDISPLMAMMPQNPAAANAPMPQMGMQVRDDMTIGTSVMMIQPLTKLYQVAYGYKARKAMLESGRHNVSTIKTEIESNMVRAFFSHLGANNMLVSAQAALKQVEAFEQMTKNYLDAELVEKNALLKVQVRKEEIRKYIFQAQKGVKLTKSMLNMQMGEPLNAPLSLKYESSKTNADTLETEVTRFQDDALKHRSELKSARVMKQAAQAGRHAMIGEMLPEINAILRYQNNYGMGDFSKDNELFGGVMLNWNFWTWGADYYNVKAAEARVEQAANSIEFAEEGIRLQVEEKYLNLEEAQKQYDVAKAALALAQENLRIEQSRYEVQESTTTDLLQAQTSKLRAENDAIVAAMEVEVARRELLLASGSDLLIEDGKNSGANNTNNTNINL